MRIPKAVLISDIHFSLQNLEVASKSLNMAYDKARELKCLLIIAGDLHDSKALLRAECVNRLIDIFTKNKDIKTYCLVGNHDKINERSEDHSIRFLSSYVELIQEPSKKEGLGLVPYQSSNDKFIDSIKMFEPGTILITHQGYLGAHMGEYIKDDSSVDPEKLKDYRIFSGHYHRHQTIGPVTFIGSPYTVTSGEYNDGKKGILILFDDSSFEHIDLKLRYHRIFEVNSSNLDYFQFDFNPGDIVRLKVSGNSLDLDKIDKRELITDKFSNCSLSIEKIYTDVNVRSIDMRTMNKELIMDKIIEQDTVLSSKQKDNLRSIVKELLNENN